MPGCCPLPDLHSGAHSPHIRRTSAIATTNISNLHERCLTRNGTMQLTDWEQFGRGRASQKCAKCPQDMVKASGTGQPRGGGERDALASTNVSCRHPRKEALTLGSVVSVTRSWTGYDDDKIIYSAFFHCLYCISLSSYP
jgi:hypothetical protein